MSDKINKKKQKIRCSFEAFCDLYDTLIGILIGFTY